MSGMMTQGIRKIADIALVVLFMLAIWLPLADELFGLDKSKKPIEKRRLAERPDFRWSWDDFLEYPSKYESYFNDHFGFRNWFINWHNHMKVQWLGSVSSPKVIKGKNDWFFCTGNRTLDYCCQATQPFSLLELARWQEILEEWRDRLAERGTRFLLVLAPNKHTIYPEYLPDWVKKIGDKSRLEQLVEHLKEHSNIEVLDLRPAFLEGKKRGRLYHRTDTHWNDYGAYIAYREIMVRLRKWFENAAPQPESDFTGSTVLGRGGDMAILMGQERSIKEERIIFQPKTPRCARKVDAGEITNMGKWVKDGEPVVMECPSGRIARAVVFRDSYCSALIPFLSEHFGRTVYIWQHRFNEEVIEHEKPDVVIFEILERLLTSVLQKNEGGEPDED